MDRKQTELNGNISPLTYQTVYWSQFRTSLDSLRFACQAVQKSHIARFPVIYRLYATVSFGLQRSSANVFFHKVTVFYCYAYSWAFNSCFRNNLSFTCLIRKLLIRALRRTSFFGYARISPHM